VFSGGKDLVVGLATIVGKTAQYVTDSTLGLIVDPIRSALPSGAQEWMRQSEAIPSAERSRATTEKMIDTVGNVGSYIANHSPEQVGADIRDFVGKNWDALKADHAAAAAKGPEAEARWWGNVTGRAVFEVASIAVPVTKVATVLKVADKVGNVGKVADNVAGLEKGLEALADAGKQLDNARSTGGLSSALKAGSLTPEGLTLLAKAGKLTAKEISEVVTHLGVKTPRDQLVLWSGLGAKGDIRAAAYAKEAGGMTLEMTKGGKWLDDLKLFDGGAPNIADSAAMEIWEQASKQIADQASGQVRVAAGQILPKSVYMRIERPALLDNAKVLGIEVVQLKPQLKAN
jgi:hypothetical protein